MKTTLERLVAGEAATHHGDKVIKVEDFSSHRVNHPIAIFYIDVEDLVDMCWLNTTELEGSIKFIEEVDDKDNLEDLKVGEIVVNGSNLVIQEYIILERLNSVV